jgi:hypothetical protein
MYPWNPLRPGYRECSRCGGRQPRARFPRKKYPMVCVTCIETKVPGVPGPTRFTAASGLRAQQNQGR